METSRPLRRRTLKKILCCLAVSLSVTSCCNFILFVVPVNQLRPFALHRFPFLANFFGFCRLFDFQFGRSRVSRVFGLRSTGPIPTVNFEIFLTPSHWTREACDCHIGHALFFYFDCESVLSFALLRFRRLDL